jgi:CheY-like chemotaxis protein
MDGMEALKQIRSLESTTSRRTPVIALTANAIKGDKEYFLENGMDDYLSKPIEFDAIKKILKVHILY